MSHFSTIVSVFSSNWVFSSKVAATCASFSAASFASRAFLWVLVFANISSYRKNFHSIYRYEKKLRFQVTFWYKIWAKIKLHLKISKEINQPIPCSASCWAAFNAGVDNGASVSETLVVWWIILWFLRLWFPFDRRNILWSNYLATDILKRIKLKNLSRNFWKLNFFKTFEIIG